MKGNGPGQEDKGGLTLAQGIRLDLVIAVCALLISTLATGASWWQARVLGTQTRVLEEQLGAQVWPYLSVSESIDGNTVKVIVENDGLGPAVVRSASATVDGIARGNFIDIMHALLGPHLVARKPHGEKLGLSLSGVTPGSVLRAGDSVVPFALTSKRFAAPFLRGYRRLNFHTCYCAIIPGTCWLSDSQSSSDPQPVKACPEVRNDLLHASAIDELLNQTF